MTAVGEPLAAILALVREAAREGAQAALSSHAITDAPAPLIGKGELARALSVSAATVDRLCRAKRIPFVHVGDVRRFDLAAVRVALDAGDNSEPSASAEPKARMTGVRCLSRK